MSSAADDDLKPSTTEGYKVGQKKTLDEYANLDKEDESLARWKQSLGIGAGAVQQSLGDPGDTRKVVILELSLLIDGREPVVIDLSKSDVIKTLKENPFTIKEGVEYRMKVRFRVQHEVISGLRYLHQIKRKGIRVDKVEEMMGSYGPNTKEVPYYEKTFAEETAPDGMLYRGNYEAYSKFMDDDHNTHLEFNWRFEIKKTWD